MIYLLAPVFTYLTSSLINAIIALDANTTPIPILILGRLLVPGVITLGYALYNAKTIVHLSPIYFAHSCMRYAALICSYYGYRHLPMQLVTIIGFTQPFFTVVISQLVTHDVLSKYEIAWLIVGCGCACSTTFYQDTTCNESSCFATLVMIGANVLAAIITILSKRLTNSDGAARSTTAISITTALLACIYAYFTGVDSTATIDARNTTLMLLALGSIGAMHTFMFQYALVHFSPSFLSSFQYIKIPFAMVFDYYLLNRSINLYTVPGAIGIMIATAKFTQHHQARTSCGTKQL